MLTILKMIELTDPDFYRELFEDVDLIRELDIEEVCTQHAERMEKYQTPEWRSILNNPYVYKEEDKHKIETFAK